jgi:hypothetical protein
MILYGVLQRKPDEGIYNVGDIRGRCALFSLPLLEERNDVASGEPPDPVVKVSFISK